MAVTNRDSGTNIHEIADRIYRINTPVAVEGGPGAFSFNQYLIVDDEPLLFHTGPRKMFPLVREAVASVMPPGRLRYIAFSHVEADECGSLNEWLAAAPRSVPLCGKIAAMVSIDDLADRPARARRRRDAGARRTFAALVRYAASAARVGMRFPDGRTD
jgi:flavorubredoxin